MQSKFFYLKLLIFVFAPSILFSSTPAIASATPKPTPITVAALPAADIALARRQSLPDIHQDLKHGAENHKSTSKPAPASNPIPIRPNPVRSHSMTERVPRCVSSSAPSHYKATIYTSPKNSPFASPFNSKSPSPMNVPSPASPKTKNRRAYNQIMGQITPTALSSLLLMHQEMPFLEANEFTTLTALLELATKLEHSKSDNKAKKDDVKN